MYQGFNNICHGCGGKGWVSPNYGTAAKCPVCGGSGQPSTTTIPNVPVNPYTPNISWTIPPWTITSGKCPNVGPDGLGMCNCTGACIGYGVPVDWLLSDVCKKSDSKPPEHA